MRPPNTEAPGTVAAVAGRGEQEQGNGRHCGAALHVEQLHAAADRKRLATLQAVLATKGFELRRLGNGAWIISKWNLAREAQVLDDVERFARQVGAVQ
jgi:hypothetical protein